MEIAKHAGRNVLFHACLACWTAHSSFPDDSIMCWVLLVARQLPKATNAGANETFHRLKWVQGQQ